MAAGTLNYQERKEHWKRVAPLTAPIRNPRGESEESPSLDEGIAWLEKALATLAALKGGAKATDALREQLREHLDQASLLRSYKKTAEEDSAAAAQAE